MFRLDPAALMYGADAMRTAERTEPDLVHMVRAAAYTIVARDEREAARRNN